VSDTNQPDDAPVPGPSTEAPGSGPPPAGQPAGRPIGGIHAEPTSAGDETSGIEAGASPFRGVGLALLAATVGAAILVFLGGPLSFSYGLIIVAYFIGRFAAVGLKVGAGDTISSTNRVTIAILVSLFAVALGQMGLWVFANSEGGRLSMVDYLATVYGALVPIEFIIATLAAWWGSR
jgi:hypothetical protein